jgi:hypothetical protein
MTKFQLMTALFAHGDSPANILTWNGNTFHVLAIEKEDGGSHNFNLVIKMVASNDFAPGKEMSLFIRTVD